VPNVQWKTPDDGRRNCPKHVEFLDKNKFGKLVRLLVLLKINIINIFLLIFHLYISFGSSTYDTMDVSKKKFQQ
jgi:hypothetical protein